MRAFFRVLLVVSGSLTVSGAAEEAVWSALGQMPTAEKAAALRARMAGWEAEDPGGPGPWLKVCGMQELQGDAAAAVATLREGLEALPGNVTLRCRLAGALVSRASLTAGPDGEQWGEGVRLYHSLLTECADPQEALGWAGELARTAETSPAGLGQAVAGWAEAEWRTQPDNPLGLAVAVICEAPGSADGMRAWLAGHPESALMLQVAGWWEHTLGHRPDRALPLLRRAEKLEPLPGVRLQLARAAFAAGVPEEALAVLEDLAALPPEVLPAAMAEVAGTLYLEEALWEEGAAFLRPHAAAAPENYRLAFLLGACLEEAGRFREARDEYLRILTMPLDRVPARALPLAGWPVPVDGRGLAVLHRPVRLGATALIPGAPARALAVVQELDACWEAWPWLHRHNAAWGSVRLGLLCRYEQGCLLPGTLEECVIWTLPHLSAIWTESTAGDRKSLEAAVERAGLPGRWILPLLCPGRPEDDDSRGNSKWWRHPEIVQALAAWDAARVPSAVPAPGAPARPVPPFPGFRKWSGPAFPAVSPLPVADPWEPVLTFLRTGRESEAVPLVCALRMQAETRSILTVVPEQVPPELPPGRWPAGQSTWQAWGLEAPVLRALREWPVPTLRAARAKAELLAKGGAVSDGTAVLTEFCARRPADRTRQRELLDYLLCHDPPALGAVLRSPDIAPAVKLSSYFAWENIPRTEEFVLTVRELFASLPESRRRETDWHWLEDMLQSLATTSGAEKEPGSLLATCREWQAVRPWEPAD